MIVKISLCGATGRIGQMIRKRIYHFPELQIDNVFPKNNVKDYNLPQFCASGNMIIDFSSPELSIELLKHALQFNNKLVIGTTGFSQAQFALIRKASKKIAIFQSANMSVGINIICSLVANITKNLDENYDIDIIETHHRHKKDHPSGTALMLQKAAAKNNLILSDYQLKNGLPRTMGSINISSIRSGNIIGTHEVTFTSNSEIISVKHQALDRNLFADGALNAALWLSKQNKAGLYSIADMLTLI